MASAPNYPVAILAINVLTTTGQLATYTITAATGDAWYLRMGALGSSVRPQIRVFADDGSLVCQNYSYGYAISLGPCLVPRAGVYTVLANAFSEPTLGAYGLIAQRMRQPVAATVIYVGRDQHGMPVSAVIPSPQRPIAA
jgi:hypothetical protein